MHTARTLDASLFDIRLNGRSASRDDLLGEWGLLHRFGVVVHEGFGAVGCSSLLQTAITAFYDIRPSRRNRSAPVHPDVFVFHVGAPFGDHAFYDVFPPRKEVVVPNDPVAILNAINDRGITHLAVPDRRPEPVQHEYKERGQAIDRITRAWAYSPGGQTTDTDVSISSDQPIAEANSRISLAPLQSYQDRQEAERAAGKIELPSTEGFATPRDRSDEVSAHRRQRILDSRTHLVTDRGHTETYRTRDIDDALRMLHTDSSPAFEVCGLQPVRLSR